jgi:hypothetical protein
MNESKELMRPCSEAPYQHLELIGPPSQEEQQSKESQAEPKPSLIGRLSKFFGWWIVIAGVSSYV